MTGNETEFIHLRDWGDAPKETPLPEKRIGPCIVHHFDNGPILIGQGDFHQSQLKYVCTLGWTGGLQPIGPGEGLFLDDIIVNKNKVLFTREATWTEQRHYEDELAKHMRAKRA